MNTLYNHFNIYDFSEELSVFNNVAPGQSNVQVDRNKVLTLFRGTKERKSPGPDGIRGRILKNCAEQLAHFLFYFQNVFTSPHRPSSLERLNYCSGAKNQVSRVS